MQKMNLELAVIWLEERRKHYQGEKAVRTAKVFEEVALCCNDDCRLNPRQRLLVESMIKQHWDPNEHDAFVLRLATFINSCH